ncbi:MAG: hypothetical protein QOE33_12 [Acidobacteriota bacterium]|nr:hypothetical protein [Acidobacteriota bacterium]
MPIQRVRVGFNGNQLSPNILGGEGYPCALFCGRLRANDFHRPARETPVVICRTPKPFPSVALGLLVACVCAQAQGSRHRAESGKRTPAAAPVVFLDSTRERDGLKGAVRRVETEVVKVELKGGAVVEKSRSVLERTLYDERGHRAENETFPVVSNAAGQEVHSYDAQGNLAETILRDTHGATLSRTIYKYEFDAFGNWVKMTASLAVLSAGKIAYEPIEITNRSITYYATDGPAARTSNSATDAAAEKKADDVHRGAPRIEGDTARVERVAPRAEGARVAHASAREIEVGVLNDRATSLPPPAFRVAGRRLDKPVTVSVEVVVDQTGLVVEARAQDAPRVLGQAAEDAARRATFFPFYSEGHPVRARGRLNFGFYFAP